MKSVYSPANPAVSPSGLRGRRGHQELRPAAGQAQPQFGNPQFPAHPGRSWPLPALILPLPAHAQVHQSGENPEGQLHWNGRPVLGRQTWEISRHRGPCMRVSIFGIYVCRVSCTSFTAVRNSTTASDNHIKYVANEEYAPTRRYFKSCIHFHLVTSDGKLKMFRHFYEVLELILAIDQKRKVVALFHWLIVPTALQSRGFNIRCVTLYRSANNITFYCFGYGAFSTKKERGLRIYF